MLSEQQNLSSIARTRIIDALQVEILPFNLQSISLISAFIH